MTAVLDHAADLEKLLLQHDVTVFGYERRDDVAIVRFVMNDQKLRLVVTMPDFSARKYTTTEQGRERSVTAHRDLYWKDVRATWSAMKNLIAAKMAAIEMGITSFETEFRQFQDAEALLGSGE